MLASLNSISQSEREKQEAGFAWLLDKSDEERRGGSIDQHIRAADSDKCIFTVIDLPGSRKYVKNLAAGLTGADTVILVIDASFGQFEAHMEDGDSNSVIKQLVLMISAFGLSKSIIVLVNKMECCQFDQSRFKTITSSIEAALRKAVGPKDVARFIPISALHKHNIDSPSDKMPWYTGSTFFEALRSISEEQQQSSIKAQAQRPLRITLREVYLVGGIGACACGKIESGTVEVGQEVIFAPSGLSSKVRSIEVHGRSVTKGVAGEFIGMTLEGVLSIDLFRGMVVIPRPPTAQIKQSLPLQVSSLQAKIVVNRSEGIRLMRVERPGTSSASGQQGKSRRGKKEALDLNFVLAVHSTHCACRIKRIVSRLDKKTKEKAEDGPSFLSASDFGVIEIEPLSGCPLYLEEHASPSPIGCLGRLLLFENVPRQKDVRQIAAFGVVTSVTWKLVEVQPGSLLRRPGVDASASSGA